MINTMMKMQLMDYDLWTYIYDKYDLYSIDPNVVIKFSYGPFREEIITKLVNGTYEWHPPRVAKIPKDDGGIREVLILEDENRFVMSAITEVYYRLFSGTFHKSCVSYQKGVSVPNILREVKSKCGKIGYKVDLSKYFDSVPYYIIEEVINSLLPECFTTKALLDFYQDNRIIVDGKIIPHFKSLCQGCSFSSLLANLVLKDIDEKMYGLSDVYYRYSDDILILDDNADELLSILTEELSKKGLKLNPKKVERIDGEFTFLGGKITKDYIHWSDKKRERLKKKINHICKMSGKKNDRDAQKKIIKRIQRMLFSETEGYSYFQQLCYLASDDFDATWLSKYCKDKIRASFTGTNNFTRNRNKTPDTILMELGWVNLDFLYNLFKTNYSAYRTRIKFLEEKVLQYYVDEISVEYLSEMLPYLSPEDFNLCGQCVKLEGYWYKVKKVDYGEEGIQALKELWQTAKYYNAKKTILNTMAYSKNGEPYYMYDEVREAYISVLFIIITSKMNFDKLFISTDDLVIFREWVS